MLDWKADSETQITIIIIIIIINKIIYLNLAKHNSDKLIKNKHNLSSDIKKHFSMKIERHHVIMPRVLLLRRLYGTSLVIKMMHMRNLIM